MGITREVATQEVDRWLDHKRVKDRVREDMADSIEELIEHFMDKTLRLDDDFNIIQNLEFPIENSEGEVTVSELSFAPRIKVRLVNEAMKGIKATEVTKMLTANVAALTGKPYAVINNLEYDDYKVGRTIAGFFL